VRKASRLYAELYKENSSNSEAYFQASRGWLWHFFWSEMEKLALQGERDYSNDPIVNLLELRSLQKLLESEKLSFNQLYNCDETGLCNRKLASKTLAARSEEMSLL